MSYITIVSLKVEDDKIYFGGYGKLLCLKEKDSSLIWKNDLKGWGFGYVIFSNTNTDEAMAVAKKPPLLQLQFNYKIYSPSFQASNSISKNTFSSLLICPSAFIKNRANCKRWFRCSCVECK